jgi:hypothetical protein
MADGSLSMDAKPTEEIDVRDVFGIDTDMRVKGFAERSDRVPRSTRPTSSTPTPRSPSSRASPTTAA